MAKNFIPNYKDLLDKHLLKNDVVREGLMFGCPGYYVNGKLAACHYNDNLIIKLPAETVESLLANNINASKYSPMGDKRSMGKNWVFLKIESTESLKGYLPLVDDSIEFILSITK